MEIGLTAEWSLILAVLKVVAGVVGGLLLIWGHRLARLTPAVFWLVMSMVAGRLLLGRIHLLLAIGFSLLLFYGFLWLHNRLPRLTMGAACLFPLPAFWGVILYFSGSFNFRPLVALAGALLGAAAGALLPRYSLALLAPAMGIGFLAFAWPEKLTFAIIAIPAVLAVAGQAADLFRLSRLRRLSRPERRTWRQLLGDWRWGAASVLGLFVLMALLAPLATPRDARHSRRLQAVQKKGLLTVPMISFSRVNNYWLSGRADPIAILAPHPSFLSRLSLLTKGRSPSRKMSLMRAVKDDDEVASIRKACQLTALAMSRVPSLVRPGINEHLIEEEILKTFREGGSSGPAFELVVASGPNATLPHYGRNNAVLKDGFVVVDIGCMMDGYASDMTRTFPVAGTYTAAQKELLAIVEKSKHAAEAVLKPGVTFKELDAASRKVIRDAGFGKYYTHSVGHGVGVDVHDVAPVKMEPNAVITLEPGIYVPEGAATDPRYWNLGVRVEDTYRVTPAGYEVLTALPAPTEPTAPGSPLP
jgi:hypothetical protein